MTRVVIVGGGIAGLTTAAALLDSAERRDVEIIVLEGGSRPGGNIRSERVDGYLCEWGANGFLDSAPATLELVGTLGLERELVTANAAARRRFVYRRGALHTLPGGPIEFLRSGLLSARGKLRLLAEPFAPRRPDLDETVYAFAARRIGREAADALIDPMVAGIFAGDAQRLSLKAVFPKMWEMETQDGGLFRALVARRRQQRGTSRGISRGMRGMREKDGGDALGAPAGTLTSFRGGMETLIHALAARLGAALRTGCEVRGIGRRWPGDGFRVELARAAPIDADAVVLAGPASVTASLVAPLDTELAFLLRGIPFAPLAVVCLGYDEAAVAANRGPLDGFGLLVARREAQRVLGVLWDSSIFPNRAPAGRVLLRAMLGGSLDPYAVDADDGRLIRIVRNDLRTTMGLTVEPSFVRIIRHRRGIPQYVTGHLDRLARIEARVDAHPGLFLTGNSYRGVAVNSCIVDAGRTAEQIVTHLHDATRPVLCPA